MQLVLTTPGAARVNPIFDDGVLIVGRKRYPYSDIERAEVEKPATGILSYGKLTVTLKNGKKLSWSFEQPQNQIAILCAGKVMSYLTGGNPNAIASLNGYKHTSLTGPASLPDILLSMCQSRGMTTDYHGWPIRKKNFELIAQNIVGDEVPKLAFVGNVDDFQSAFVATDRRIIMARKKRTGGETVLSISWHQVNDIYGKKGIYGTVILDSLHEVIKVMVPNKLAVPLANDLMNVLHEVKSPAPQLVVQQVATPTASDPYEELKKAKELLDMGILTQNEFDAKKKQLLGL